jgi:hypothetical protein
MPSKVNLSPRIGLVSFLFRQLRIVATFALTTLAAYCGVTGLTAHGHHAGRAATTSERAAP